MLLKQTTFEYAKTINWFPGHMAKGMKQIKAQVRSVDLVVEARDARIPLSSINMRFEQVLNGNGKKRLVVYNKSDLAPLSIQPIVKDQIMKQERVIFTDTQVDRSVRQILKIATENARRDPLRYPQYSIMVIGMPNVGKSSLINALRRIGVQRGKAASTGAKPGVTRAMSSKIKVLDDPPIYLLDTPGVMVPHIPDPETALKVALTGGIKDNIADESILADYLLYRLNRLNDVDYCKVLAIDRATDNINELIDMLSRKIGALQKGGETDVSKTLHYFLRTYRQGKFGRLCLDDLSKHAVAEFFSKNAVDQLSKRQAKKKQKQT